MADNDNDSGSSYRKNPIPGKSVEFPKLKSSKDPSPPDSDNDVPELADSAIFAIVKEKEASGRAEMGSSVPLQTAAAAVLSAVISSPEPNKRVMSTSSDKCSPPHKKLRLMDESMSPIMSKEAEDAFAKAISPDWMTNNLFMVAIKEDKAPNVKKRNTKPKKNNLPGEDGIPQEEVLFVEKTAQK